MNQSNSALDQSGAAIDLSALQDVIHAEASVIGIVITTLGNLGDAVAANDTDALEAAVVALDERMGYLQRVQAHRYDVVKMIAGTSGGANGSDESLDLTKVLGDRMTPGINQALITLRERAEEMSRSAAALEPVIIGAHRTVTGAITSLYQAASGPTSVATTAAYPNGTGTSQRNTSHLVDRRG